MRNKYAYQHLFSSSHVPEDCPRALQPAEHAQSPKVHRKPASVVMRKLRAMMVNKKSFIMDGVLTTTAVLELELELDVVVHAMHD